MKKLLLIITFSLSLSLSASETNRNSSPLIEDLPKVTPENRPKSAEQGYKKQNRTRFKNITPQEWQEIRNTGIDEIILKRAITAFLNCPTKDFPRNREKIEQLAAKYPEILRKKRERRNPNTRCSHKSDFIRMKNAETLKLFQSNGYPLNTAPSAQDNALQTEYPIRTSIDMSIQRLLN
jgi:hypothetical protein